MNTIQAMRCVSVIVIVIALGALNVVMIAELRDEGRADRAACKHESARGA